MFTIALGMTLKSGAYEQYKLAHEQIWPELAAGMRENQISMSIYRDGDRLFLFATAPTQEHWERSRKGQALAQWDARIAQLVQTDEGGHIAFTPLTKAFGFGDFT